MAAAEHTRDHETIKQWAEERGGVPAIVEGTGGLLRIDFIEGEGSGGHEPRLRETTWDEWFEVFDDRDLEFLYSPAADSRFFKLISEETAARHDRSTREEHAPRQ